MNVQRFDLVNHQEEYESAEMIGFVDGDYVLHTDYATLEARCTEMEYALVEISKLPDCDSDMCRQIARDALADTTTGEVQS